MKRISNLQAARQLLALTCGLAAPFSALPFGAEGHRIVAAAAEAQLTPAARQAIRELLALEPGASLESISTWADDAKSPSTARWHYVNLPRGGGCSFSAARDCPGGQCVVSAIRSQVGVLSSTAPAAARLKALKYVVHLVADVHQPLHGGFADDRGGNTYQVHAQGTGTNLHAVWDSWLIDNWPGGRRVLRRQVLGTRTEARGAFKPERWAEESCEIASRPGFYPDGHKLGASYAEKAAPVVLDRLASAGQRLADILNRSFGTE